MGNKRVMVVVATLLVVFFMVVAVGGNWSQAQKMVPTQPMAPSSSDPFTFCGSHWIDELQTVVHGSCLYGQTKPAPVVQLPPAPMMTRPSASFRCRGIWDEWADTIVSTCPS